MERKTYFWCKRTPRRTVRMAFWEVSAVHFASSRASLAASWAKAMNGAMRRCSCMTPMQESVRFSVL